MRPADDQLSELDWELGQHEWPHSRAARERPAHQTLTPTTSQYVELHLHSHWSLLEGASTVRELVATAKGMGYTGLALTDHDGLFGAMEFAQIAREAGLQPITGAELTMEDGSHLTLLAETVVGYGNLCRLVSVARGHGAPSRDAEERLRTEPRLPWSALATHAAGLICLTGCRLGRVPRLTQEGLRRDAEQALLRLIDWFGQDSVFVELQNNEVFGDTTRNQALAELAKELGVGIVATGDVHYHVRERHRLQDVMVSIKHRKTLDESHRERRPNSEFFLRSPGEQQERLAAYPEAIAFRERRCVVPADGFFEWTGPKQARQPLWFHRPEGGLIYFAGLYASWKPGDQWERTFTIVTTEPNALMAPIHDRMPVILSDDVIDHWLDPAVKDEDLLRSLLVAPLEELLIATPVSPRVNSVKNDDPACLEPMMRERA